MKKYPLIFFLAIMLLLTGCVPSAKKGKGSTDISFSDSFEMNFIARFGLLDAKGKMSFSPECLIIEFTAPETVSGLKIKVTDTETQFSINGLSVSKQNNSVLKSLNADAVFLALKDALKNTDIKKTDTGFLNVGNGFEIELDSEKRVCSILIPNRKIEIRSAE